MASLTDEMRKAIKAQLTAAPEPPKHENRSRRTSAGLWVRPFHSESLGVDPSQIDEARNYLRAHGIPAEFDSQGRCIVTSEKQFREVAKACGLWDGRDGFGPRDEEGRKILSGRQPVQARREFRRRLDRGEIEL